MALEDVPEEVRSEVARLNTQDREFIRQTHERMTTRIPNYALSLFIRLFAEHPNYKDIWPQFRAIPDSSLMSSNCLQNHAYVYMAGLRNIVTAMEDEERLCQQCKKIAMSHIKWNIYKYHIQNMVPELIGVAEMAGGTMTAEEKCAWTKLYDIIGNLVDYYKKRRLYSTTS